MQENKAKHIQDTIVLLEECLWNVVYNSKVYHPKLEEDIEKAIMRYKDELKELKDERHEVTDAG